jgi:regulator of sigma E protease
MQILLFVLGVILFISLVLIHEWGHFFIARLGNVDIEEFGLGFPPRAWSKKLKSGMILSLNWLPLGGFVKLKGEYDADDRKGSFGAAGLWVKSKILLAGVTMNLIAGIVLLTILAVVGMPKLIDNQFSVSRDTKITSQNVYAGYVLPNSPAAGIGLKSQDTILKVAHGSSSDNITTAQQLHDDLTTLAGQKVQITYKHNDQVKTSSVKLLSDKEVNASLSTSNPKGHLGITPTELQIRRSTWSAPIVALGFTKQLAVLTLQGLGHAVAGLGSAIAGVVTNNHQARENGQAQATEQTGGIVAIMAILWNGGALGINFILMIVAVVSLTLAIINILPIPALDGGRLFVMLFSRKVLRHPLSQTVEEWVHGTGMIVILTLFVLITIVDVRRFF